MTIKMDTRIGTYIEKELGCSLESFPSEGVDLRQSDQRSDTLGSRALLVRVGNAAVVTAIPRVMDAIAPLVRRLDIWELFSPFGVAELSRASREQEVKFQGGGFHYAVCFGQYQPPLDLDAKTVTVLDVNMIPKPEYFDREWFNAFMVNCEGQEVSLSRIRWKARDFIEIAVDTREEYRGRGFGTAVVAAATEWIISRDAVAHYPVIPSNLPSIRIPRRLGFTVAWQEIYA